MLGLVAGLGNITLGLKLQLHTQTYMHTQAESKPDLCPTSCDMKEAILPGLVLRLEEIGSRGCGG